MQEKVALTKNKDHVSGIVACLNFLEDDLYKRLSEVREIVIKINFVTTRNELATTPYLAVSTFIDFILPFYKGRIIIAEEASIGNTKKGFERYGFVALIQKYSQVKLLNLSEDKIVRKTIRFKRGEITLPFSQTLLTTPFLVSITRPKTHDEVVVTLGIKNVLVGAIVGGMSERMKIHQGMFIHEIMAEIADLVYPNLVIIDGTCGMEGNGPSEGNPIRSGWTIGSFDALAADSLATYLMGFDLKDVGYLNLLKEKGVGKFFQSDKIKVIGELPEKLITPFKPHDTFKRQREWQSILNLSR